MRVCNLQEQRNKRMEVRKKVRQSFEDVRFGFGNMKRGRKDHTPTFERDERLMTDSSDKSLDKRLRRSRKDRKSSFMG